ncbi:hypothetical protein NLM33_38095 [Bradyrhizobium sp. CCGUVB1N3]|uniref:hypothetical protein n=1 Tax=Bradyrhizobium sp. CCGUVB1N3 TaxID=2949629 RepID=UPI0020B29550|nr:hypothetical protein [Bradyrhizobium sp. CCGUVB1N3]MCP3476047.1 hypothetical protein [Bradyrhizobium sp. CCGUVB1N3]
MRRLDVPTFGLDEPARQKVCAKIAPALTCEDESASTACGPLDVSMLSFFLLHRKLRNEIGKSWIKVAERPARFLMQFLNPDSLLL